MGDAHKHDEKARHASIDYHAGVGKGQFTQEGFQFQNTPQASLRITSQPQPIKLVPLDPKKRTYSVGQSQIPPPVPLPTIAPHWA
jgi:hypothetical protein